MNNTHSVEAGGVPTSPPMTVLRKCVAVAALVIALIAAVTDPFKPVLFLVLLGFYVAVLWQRPGAWLIWVLALLPLLDFAPYSGRLFWSEFDTLLLATLGVCYWRITPGPLANISRVGWGLLATFTVSAVVGVLIGLWPLAPLNANAFSNYMSPYNALRAAKGLFFSLLYLPLLSRQWEDPGCTARRLAWGMTLGLSVEILYVLWERVTFPGLFNFFTGYRITGTFPAMHIGGAYIECYLVMMLPFVLLWAWQWQRLATTLLAVGVYSLGAYGVMVTYSRAGELAFILATVVAAFGFARIIMRDRKIRSFGIGVTLFFTAAAFVVAWPIVSGRFNEARLSFIGRDFHIRFHHWKDALSILRRNDALIWGEGLGSFPRSYFLYSRAAAHPASYGFHAEDGNEFLRLGSGETLYFEQVVKLEPNRHYTLRLDLRSMSTPATLAVPVCEKALLYSFRCDWNMVSIKTRAGEWGHYTVRVNTRRFGPTGSLFPRPIKLSMFNASDGTIIDVDNVTLSDDAGCSLVMNGNFSQGMAHWFFSTDRYLSWHAQNLLVHVLFEQGLVGLVIFLSLIAYAGVRLLKWGWCGDPLAITLLTSLGAFMVVGVGDSLIDETRIGFLFFLLLSVGLLVTPSSLRRSDPSKPCPFPPGEGQDESKAIMGGTEIAGGDRPHPL